MVHISTNAVFAPHPTRLWLPGDKPKPSTPYENAKLYGEDPRAYIIRSSFVGVSTGPPRGVLDAMLRGEPFWDRDWNGVTTVTLARRVAEVLRIPGIARGLEHLHSSSVTSFANVARLIGSTSQVLGIRSDAKLLGGGLPTPPLELQVAELLKRVVY